MTRLVLSVRGKTIGAADLSEPIRVRRDGAPALTPGVSLKQAVVELEKRLILEALERSRHNQQRAAMALGVSRQGLIKKIKRYALKLSS